MTRPCSSSGWVACRGSVAVPGTASGRCFVHVVEQIQEVAKPECKSLPDCRPEAWSGRRRPRARAREPLPGASLPAAAPLPPANTSRAARALAAPAADPCGRCCSTRSQPTPHSPPTSQPPPPCGRPPRGPGLCARPVLTHPTPGTSPPGGRDGGVRQAAEGPLRRAAGGRQKVPRRHHVDARGAGGVCGGARRVWRRLGRGEPAPGCAARAQRGARGGQGVLEAAAWPCKGSGLHLGARSARVRCAPKEGPRGQRPGLGGGAPCRPLAAFLR